MIAGLRFHIGIDSIRYEIKYDFVPVLSDLTTDDLLHSNLKAEPLFMLLYSLARTISNEFWVMQMLQAILVISVFWRFTKKNTSYWFISAFLFTLILYLNFTCEILRESCAVSMFLLGWEYFKEKKWLKFYLCAIASILFHSGAIFLLIIPLIDIFKVPRLIEKGAPAIGAFVVSLILIGGVIQANFGSYFQLLSFIESLSDKADLYTDGRLAGQILNIKGVITTIINFMIYPIVALYTIKKRGICHPAIKTMLFMALTVSILQIPVALMYRFNNYFLPFVIVALAEVVFSEVKTNREKGITVRRSYASCMMVLIPYIIIQLYSYRAPVGNTGHRMYEIYTPYSSILDKTTEPGRTTIYRYYGAE